MGGDGGVIANQRAFVRGAGKSEDSKRDKVTSVQDEQRTRATTCALTNEPLQSPVAACELGNLFNKEALITALLGKRVPREFSHIRGLKDVKTLEFSTSTVGSRENVRICPITQDEFNGLHPFVVLWTSGKVLSERAIRQIGIDGLQTEYGPFTSLDVVRLIPLEQEMDEARRTMHTRRETRRSKKSSASHAPPDTVELPTTNSESRKRGVEARQEEKVDTKRSRTTVSVNLPQTAVVVDSALGSVGQQSQQSRVYQSLFHKDGEKDKRDKDLFMTVAGLRYTIN